MPTFSIDTETCTACGLCVSVCPSSVIAAGKGKQPRMRKGREEYCISCGHCVIYCPAKAAHVSSLPEDQIEQVNKSLLPQPEALDMLCKSRRTARRFAKREVSKDVLEEILNVARYAPSAKNGQPVRWIGIHEHTALQTLGDLVADWFESDAAQTDDAVEKAKKTLLARAWKAGEDPIFRNGPHLLLAVSPKSDFWESVDSSIALTYLEIAATARGVGCCWAGYVTIAARSSAAIQSFLGLDAHETVSGGQIVGYSLLTPRSIPPRKPLNLCWL